MSAIRQRGTELNLLLLKLCGRPDIRQSEPFRTYIDFDSHTSYASVPHELGRGRTNVDARFGIIGLSTIGEVMVAAHSDTTSLARLGKIWSIVEADELAQLSIWKTSRGPGSPDSSEYGEPSKLGEKLFARALPERVNAIKLTNNGQIVLGMGNGLLAVFEIQNPSKATASFAAHGTSPVTALDVTKEGMIVSVGLDEGLRLSSIESAKVLSGGKLTKRMESGEILTCIRVVSDRVFIGSDKGRVFIFEISSFSPSFLHTLSMSSYPVHRVSTDEQSNQLLVTFDTFANVYDLKPKGQEKEMTRKYQIQSIGTSQIITAIFMPGSTDMVAAGLGDGSVCLYSGPHLIYSRYFSEEQVNVLHIALPDGALWLGGDDGRIVEVLVPSTLKEDAKYAAESAAAFSGEAVYENRSSQRNENVKPLPASGISESPKKLPVRSNPECLKKSTALAEDDSDDEWRKGLFSK